jgi:UDP-glucose 4-epimerase
MESVLITGGAGFLGSHLADRLIEKGFRVRVLDNFSSGREVFLKQHEGNPDFDLRRVDLLRDDITEHFQGIDKVFHLSANRDIKVSMENTGLDIEQNVLVTHRVMEAVRKSSVRDVVFTSTSAVYGEAKTMPTPEDYSPMNPISVYGSSKLACESMLSSYYHSFGISATILRLANVIGERSDHGVVFDFVKKLEDNPQRLEILGDGEQNKSYLDARDFVEAVMVLMKSGGLSVYNVGSETQVRVSRIAEIVSEEMGVKPEYNFTGGKRGWKGDVPLMMLDIERLKSLGWKPVLDSEGAVRKAARYYF